MTSFVSSIAPTGSQFTRLIAAQRIRATTLRSTAYILAALVAGWCAVTGLASYAQAGTANGEELSGGPSGSPPGFLGGDSSMVIDSANMTANGVIIAQLIVIVFAVLAFTAEFASGSTRALFLVAPRRTGVIVSTAAVSAGIVFALSLVASFAAFLLASTFLSSADLNTALGDPNQLRIVLGSALYLTVLAVFATALAVLMRSTAAGIATSVGAVLVLPLLVALLPGDWSDSISPWLPTSAGMAIARPENADSLGPWQGIGVFALYSVVLLVVSVVSARKRDA